MAGKEKLLGVQYLRAIAALMVAYFHLIVQCPAYTPYLATHAWVNTDFLQSGVPVFFVISGFVMYASGIETRPGEFVWRRISRILPLYWTLTIAIVVLALMWPGFLHHPEITEAAVAKSLLFVPYFRPGSHEIFPILGPGWSLDFEIFFYALFTLALFAPLRLRLTTVLLSLIVSFAIGTAVPAVQTNAIGLAYTSDLLLLFAVGLILGWLYKARRIAIPPAMALIVSLLGFCALIVSWSPAFVHEFIAPSVTVLGVIALDAAGATPTWPWLLMLGDASYSIYLVHLFAFDLVEKEWLRHQPPGGAIAAAIYAVLSIGAAIGMSLITYRLIERRALKYLTQHPMVKRRQAAATVPGS